MRCSSIEGTTSQDLAAKIRHGVISSLFMGVWMAPVIAGGIIVLFLVLGRVHFSGAGRSFIMALTYSVAIGTPSSILLSWCSVRWTKQYPRLIILLQSLILLVTATLGTLAAGLFFLAAGILPPSWYWAEFRGSYPFCLVVSIVIGLSICAFETMRDRLQTASLELRNRQLEQERAYKLLAEARLSSLESRIHPHFLFNTLNSIAALIPTDPIRAEDTVSKLASLLRFSLSANQGGLVPLSQELKIVRDYLEIEKTRFGSRLRYEIAVPDSLGDARVPPLAIQSLVENSVKHVAAQRTEGTTIKVAGNREDGRVNLLVLDDGPGFALDAIAPDHGLANLIGRLELLYGQASRLDVSHQDGTTSVSLLLPV